MPDPAAGERPQRKRRPAPASPSGEERRLPRRAPVGSDEHAFNRLWERHHGLVRRYLLQRCSPEHAEDLAQEAFLRVWESRDRAAQGAHLPAYLITVARNLWIDHLRWQRNWGNVVPLEDVVLTADDLERQVADSLRQQSLREAVSRLSPRRRAVFELRWLRGCSHREIAELLQITIKTVENHLNAGYREVRGFFQELENGEKGSSASTPLARGEA
jgi:RNA polymerase sigma-70 factor (ECF subfamily)